MVTRRRVVTGLLGLAASSIATSSVLAAIPDADPEPELYEATFKLYKGWNDLSFLSQPFPFQGTYWLPRIFGFTDAYTIVANNYVWLNNAKDEFSLKPEIGYTIGVENTTRWTVRLLAGASAESPIPIHFMFLEFTRSAFLPSCRCRLHMPWLRSAGHSKTCPIGMLGSGIIPNIITLA